ncbi:hypothetical protein XELAEV_18023673mg [Xenopus laevis]|uniref:Uncharacterized protein n=1 Tax=Xenopus laevis TaxID=8355 RepID=A0A974HPB7_XENLA|nr:hypothetical protein XELAEV_18023673mg [Xenopus laevis]
MMKICMNKWEGTGAMNDSGPRGTHYVNPALTMSVLYTLGTGNNLTFLGDFFVFHYIFHCICERGNAPLCCTGIW